MDINPEPVDTEGELCTTEGETESMGRAACGGKKEENPEGDKGEGTEP